MIFSIRDLAFEIGSLYLEGWLALAARCVCALLLFAAGALVSLLLRRKLFPILLRSLDRPLERMAVFTGLYLALTSLPWAITGLPRFLLVAYKVVMSFLFCEGLYQASDVADLLLASCSLEIRSNKTLLALLNTTYKVLVTGSPWARSRAKSSTSTSAPPASAPWTKRSASSPTARSVLPRCRTLRCAPCGPIGSRWASPTTPPAPSWKS